MKFHDNRWSKIAVANIANNNACIMLTNIARQYRRQRTVRHRLRNFLHKQKQNGSLISREDGMLINVLHEQKGSKKLLAEFPNKAFELIPTVFIVLETCAFSVSVLKDKKYHNTGRSVQ